MRKETYMRLRFIPITIIICSLFTLGYNAVSKERSSYISTGSYTKKIDDAAEYFEEIDDIKKIDGELININTASEEEFKKLHGIGEATAKKIVLLRDEIGGFESEKQLLHIDGISDKKLKSILPYITVE